METLINHTFESIIQHPETEIGVKAETLQGIVRSEENEVKAGRDRKQTLSNGGKVEIFKDPVRTIDHPKTIIKETEVPMEIKTIEDHSLTNPKTEVISRTIISEINHKDHHVNQTQTIPSNQSNNFKDNHFHQTTDFNRDSTQPISTDK